MKKFGLIGGVGPESTIDYYRSIIKRFREVTRSNSYPSFLINTIDLIEMLDFVANQDDDQLVDLLVRAIFDMQKAGIEYGAIASNTPHMVYDKLLDKINLPMISIVEEACKAALTMNIKKVGLFGTKSTMTNGFYQKVADAYGLDIVIPTDSQVDYVHDKYMKEIIFKNIREKTKKGLIEIAKSLRDRQAIEGLILGGTELSLILSQDDFENIKILDSAKIHVDAIVKEMISN